jgi:hypothetical protein
MPVVRLRYDTYGVNVVDIIRPGGAEQGKYVAHGSVEWQKERRANTTEPSRTEPNEHHRLTDELFPDYPFPLYRSAWGSSALVYHGWFIVGLYDPDSGAGIGRLMPEGILDVLKLLKGRGFEFFPCFGRPHEAYTSYLYLVSSGEEEILTVGRALAESPP